MVLAVSLLYNNFKFLVGLAKISQKIVSSKSNILQDCIARYSAGYKLLARCEIFITCKISCKIIVILQEFLQEIKILQVFLQVLHARFSLFSCKICKKTDILRCKISKKYRNIRPRLWDLSCMIIARIVNVRTRWFDLGTIKGAYSR